jgi:hypothetical protein
LGGVKIDKDLRQQFDFIRRVRPYYSIRELRAMDFLTFFDVLDEVSQEEKARLDHLSNLTGQ